MKGKARAYASPLRAEQAAATRRRVLDAAARLFARDGYPATTMGGIAAEAGVAVQTVYKVFGTKAALLKRLHDVTVVGDEEPVPFAQRAEVQAVYAETDPERFLRGYAELGRLLLERFGPLTAVVVSARSSADPDLRAYAETIDRERLVGTGMVAQRLAQAGALRPGLSVERARDAIWTLNSFEVWDLLVRRRGWSTDAYVAWVADAMVAAVLA